MGMAIPHGDPERGSAPTPAWVLRSQLSSEPTDISITGHFRGACVDLVLSRGSSIELFELNPSSSPNPMSSICCQPVFGTTLDIKTLPARRLVQAQLQQDDAQDLLLMLSDSGMLSVLSFSPFLNRFFLLQQVFLAPAGFDPLASSQMMTVSPCGQAVAVASCLHTITLLQVAPQGIPHLAAELAVAAHAIREPESPTGQAWQYACILAPDPLVYSSAGATLNVPLPSTAVPSLHGAGSGGSGGSGGVLFRPPAAPNGLFRPLGSQGDVGMDGDEESTAWGTASEAGGISGSGGSSSTHSSADELMLPPPPLPAQLPGVPEEGMAPALAGTGLGEGEEQGGGFMIWDLVFLGRVEVGRGRGGEAVGGGCWCAEGQWCADDLVFRLLALTHRPGSLSSDLTLLSWQPELGVVQHVARLLLPHSSALGLPVALKHIPGTESGVVVLGTTSLLLLDCTAMCQASHPSPSTTHAASSSKIAAPTASTSNTPPAHLTAPPPSGGPLGAPPGGLASEALDLALDMDRRWSGLAAAAAPSAGVVPEAGPSGSVPLGAWVAQGGNGVEAVQRLAPVSSLSRALASSELSFHMLGSYAEMMAAGIQPWVCGPPPPPPAAPPPPATSTPPQAIAPPLVGPNGLPHDHSTVARPRRPEYEQDDHMGGVIQGGACVGGYRPHVALCSAWLDGDSGTAGQTSGGPEVQTLLVASSAGQHVCIDICTSGGHAQLGNATDEEGKYRAMLPDTRILFRLRPVSWGDQPPPECPASHMLGLPEGLLLYKQGAGAVSIFKTAAQGGALAGGRGASCQFPAVRVTPCITPEAQWAATHFARELGQQAAELGLATAAGTRPNLATAGVTHAASAPQLDHAAMQQPLAAAAQHPGPPQPSHVHGSATVKPGPASTAPHSPSLSLQAVASIPADGVVHDLVMSDITGSGHTRAFVASTGIRGGGTLPQAMSPYAPAPAKQLGQLTGQVREVHLDTPTSTISTWEAGAFPPPSGMWAVRSGTCDAHDALLLISFLSATRVLSLGSEMSDVTDLLGVSSCEETIVAGLAQEGVMAQVTPTAVVLLSLEHVTPGSPLHGDASHQGGAPGTSPSHAAARTRPNHPNSSLCSDPNLPPGLPDVLTSVPTQPGTSAGRWAAAAPAPQTASADRLRARASCSESPRLRTKMSRTASVAEADGVGAAQPRVPMPGAAQAPAAGLPAGPHGADGTVDGAAGPLAFRDSQLTSGDLMDVEDVTSSGASSLPTPTLHAGVLAAAAAVGAHAGVAGIEDVALASALRALAVGSGGEDDGACADGPPRVAVNSNGASGRGLQASGEGECVSALAAVRLAPPAGGGDVTYHLDMEACVWRPGGAGSSHGGTPVPGGSSPGSVGKGGSGAGSAGGVGATAPILTAAVALGCVVVCQASSGCLQVLSVASGAPAGGSSGSGCGPGSTSSGSSMGRKRRRQGCCMRLEGSVPMPHEVTCLKLEHLSCPVIPSRTCAWAATNSCAQAYLLLVGHRQPGVTLMQLLVTPGAGVCVTTLCDAPPPPLATRAWGHAHATAGHGLPPPGLVAPHSLQLHLTSTTLASHHPKGLCLASTSGATPASTSGDTAAAQGPAAAQPAAPSGSSGAAAARAAQQARQVVVQWLVGFRQGGLALYQWDSSKNSGSGARSCSAGVELLWAADLGRTPVSLAVLQSRPGPASPAALQPLAAAAAAARPLHMTSSEAPQTAWPAVVAVGDDSWVVHVSPSTNRVTWKQLGVTGPPLTLACAVSFPTTLPTPPADEHSPASLASESAVTAVTVVTTTSSSPLLLTVHEDTSWRFAAIAGGFGGAGGGSGGLQCLGPSDPRLSPLLPACPRETPSTDDDARGSDTQGHHASSSNISRAGSGLPSTFGPESARTQTPQDAIGGCTANAIDGRARVAGDAAWRRAGAAADPAWWRARAARVDPAARAAAEQAAQRGAVAAAAGRLAGADPTDRAALAEAQEAARQAWAVALEAYGPSYGPRAWPACMERPESSLLCDGWVTMQMLPHPQTGSLLLMGRYPMVPDGGTAAAPSLARPDQVDGEHQLYCVAACDPDTGGTKGVYRCIPYEQPTQMCTWVTCLSHFSLAAPQPAASSPGMETDEATTSGGASTNRQAPVVAAAPVQATSQPAGAGDAAAADTSTTASQPAATAAASQPAGTAAARAASAALPPALDLSVVAAGPAAPGSAAQPAATDELLVVSFDCAEQHRRVQALLRVFHVTHVTTSRDPCDARVKLMEVACVKFLGKVGAVCAPSSGSLVVAVGRRLVCLVPKQGKLTKLGWIATRTPVTLLASCSTTQMVAASDGATGVTLYCCDLDSQDPHAALQVVAADTVPRPITALCILPDTLLPPLTHHHTTQAALAETPGTIASPARITPRGAAVQQRLPYFRWALHPHEAGAPPPPLGGAAAADGGAPLDDDADLLPAWRRRALALEAPVTVLTADACGCVALLRVEPLTLSPVRNLQQAGVLHLGDVCRRAVVARPPPGGAGGDVETQVEGAAEDTVGTPARAGRARTSGGGWAGTPGAAGRAPGTPGTGRAGTSGAGWAGTPGGSWGRTR